MATGARGEGVLTLEGEQYPVLFTLRALADAERATGKTVLQLMVSFERRDFGISDTAALLAIGLEHARREHRAGTGGHNLNDAWRLLDGLGFAAVSAVVYEALAAAMSYSRPDAEGEQGSPLA